MIYDVCANNDCALGDEGRLDSFDSYEEWERAHASCYMNEEGECRR